MTRISFSEEDGVLRAAIAPVSRWWVVVFPAVVASAMAAFVIARGVWFMAIWIVGIFLGTVWQARSREIVVVGKGRLERRRELGRIGYGEECEVPRITSIRDNDGGFFRLRGWVECCDGTRIVKIGRELKDTEGEELAERIRQHLAVH